MAAADEGDEAKQPVILRGGGGNDTMVILELDSNRIGGEGARALAEGVRGSASMTELHLGDNEINMTGALALKEVTSSKHMARVTGDGL